MRARIYLLVAATVLMSASVAAPSFAQWVFYPTPGVPLAADGKADLAAPAPRHADGTPDLSGMWGWVNVGRPCGARCSDSQISREFLNIAYSLKGGPPYQPWAAALVKQRKADLAKDDPNVRCMPRGAPRIWTDDYYKRIVHAPGRLIILTERNMQYRQIFIDGRPLPEDPTPTWNGYSSAKWQGDTLVVETTGFKDDLWLDSDGNPLTSAAKMTEKIRRPSYGTLEVEITIDDPKAYTVPWTVTITQPIALDSELIDYYCLENEKDYMIMVGKTPAESNER